MEYGIIILLLVGVWVIMAWALQVRLKDLKTIKTLGFDKELVKKAQAFPDNATICKEMLQMLDNKEVALKLEEGGKEKTTLYVVATNTIWIANIQDTFTRIQTIAHECLHSIQNKTTLWFQFLLSTFYPLYFIFISILTIVGVVHHPMIHTILLLACGIVFFTIRAYLEMDAMLKARPLAEAYMSSKTDIPSQDTQTLLQGYDTINSLGVRLTLLQLWIKPMLRVIIYCTIVIILS